jgi:GNAT superfamily N-acetyltransferase
MDELTIRNAAPSDRPHLRIAIVELQEHERNLHVTRLPGETIADAYLEWMLGKAAGEGAILIAEVEGGFAGFVAGWIENGDNIAETPDSNRFGFVSDVCILKPYRGRRIASRLLEAIEAHFRAAGVVRIRIWALAANSAARASYERSGFTPYEVVYEKAVEKAR